MAVCSEDVCVLLLTKGGFQVCLVLLAMSFLALQKTGIGHDDIGKGFSCSVDS